MKLFITGISGLLGLNMALQLRDLHQISGGYFSHPVALDRAESIKLDLLSDDKIVPNLERFRPDLVIHAAGLTDVEACEADPELAHQLNVASAIHTARAAATVGAKLIHLSTDHLFDGSLPWRSEESVPSPLNVYAATKGSAEQAVLDVCPDALVIRTNFFGWGNGVRISFSDWILGALQREEPLNMFTDVWFTPILINDLTDLMLQLSDQGAKGIFNVAGKERVSKHAFALRLAEVFGVSPAGIHAASVEDFSFKAPRPKDMSLSSQKAVEFLGIPMPTLREGLCRLRSLGEQPHRAILKAAIQRATSKTTSPPRDS